MVRILKQGETQTQRELKHQKTKICPNCKKTANYGFVIVKYIREKMFGPKIPVYQCYYCDCEWIVD